MDLSMSLNCSLSYHCTASCLTSSIICINNKNSTTSSLLNTQLINCLSSMILRMNKRRSCKNLCHPWRTMTKTTEAHVIEHIIAIVLSLTISLINNIKCLFTSTHTPDTKPTVAQKKAAGGTKSARRSSQSSTQRKTTTNGATSKTGTNSKSSATKRRTRTPKAAHQKQSTTVQVDTPSCQEQMSQTDTSCLTISIPALKNTSQKSILTNDLITAK